MAVAAPPTDLKARLREAVLGMGADSVGVVNAGRYTDLVPNRQVPDYTAEGMRSIVVITKHLLTGAVVLHDVATTSLNSHIGLQTALDLTFDVAAWLEREGFIAVPVSPEFADEELAAGGAGLLDLKYTAEQAGLGHVGLNLNFLTPEFGSRVYLGAVLTDAFLPEDKPLEKPLCPGMSCGRCAVTCPTAAIPLEAPLGAGVNTYKDLDQQKCSQGAMRVGIRSLFKAIEAILRRPEPVNFTKVLQTRYWTDVWIAINSKRGAYAGCFECMYVCPVGTRDARQILRVPYRQQDIPNRVEHDRGEAVHRVKFIGPPAERAHEYERFREFEAAEADD